MFQINDRVHRTNGRVKDRARLGTVVEIDECFGRCQVLWDGTPNSKSKRTWFSKKYLAHLNQSKEIMTEEQQARLDKASSYFLEWVRLVTMEATPIRVEFTANALKHLGETKEMMDAEISEQNKAA